VLVVRMEFRHKGVGGMLLDRAIKQDVHLPIKLKVSDQNTDALRLYRSKGFLDTDEKSTDEHHNLVMRRPADGSPGVDECPVSPAASAASAVAVGLLANGEQPTNSIVEHNGG
jgi:hypothetical protein